MSGNSKRKRLWLSHAEPFPSDQRPRLPPFQMSLYQEDTSSDIKLDSLNDPDKIIQIDNLSGSMNVTTIEDRKHGIPGAWIGANGAKQPIRNGVKQSMRNGVQQPTHNGVNELQSIRSTWERRNAPSIEEGIRQEKSTSARAQTVQQSKTGRKLSSILGRASTITATAAKKTNKKKKTSKFPRFLTGLLVALAEEASDLEVEVKARRDTPLWAKRIDSIRINFSRLSFVPLRMTGINESIRKYEAELRATEKDSIAEALSSGNIFCADEAFDQIDVDKSGALDKDELATALTQAAKVMGSKEKEVVSSLASRLISLYDANGDGVVDREEYRTMVNDMSALREVQTERRKKGRSWRAIQWARRRITGQSAEEEGLSAEGSDSMTKVTVGDPILPKVETNGKTIPVDIAGEGNIQDVSDDAAFQPSSTKQGSAVISDLSLDLRRLLFGGIPFIKTITPGGPLILEPFTVTLDAQWSPQDVLTSGLLDLGLRLLVARTLRLRIRSIRNLADGAVFFGRKWNLASKEAPQIEVFKLVNVEFDDGDKMIITGRVRVKASPETPTVENSFKLRTEIGAWKDGKVIGLQNPEVALVAECPKAWERTINTACRRLGVKPPPRPKPIYTYFPLPIKEQSGYYLGEDNCIKSIYIKDGALRFQLSVVLSPGRFLGNHYLAFSVPQRTFIVTTDRVREGMRAARRNKLKADAAQREAEASLRKTDAALAKSLSELDPSSKEFTNAKDGGALKTVDGNKEDLAEKSEDKPDKPGFFSRFVEGYLGAVQGANLDDDDELSSEEMDERLAVAISEWFGRQETSGAAAVPDDPEEAEIMTGKADWTMLERMV